MLLSGFGSANGANGDPLVDLSKLNSPILLRGDEKTAFRDPAVVYHDGTFYVFFTYIRTEEAGKVYLYTALSTSRDLIDWAPPRILTPKGQRLNYSSPGNVVRFGDQWVICLQSYLMFFHGVGPGKTRTMDNAFARCSIGIAWSEDLVRWNWPGKE